MKYGGLNRLSLCSITESGSGSTWQPLTERREGRIKGRMIKKREWERQEREVEEFSIIPWFKMVTQKKVVRKEKEKMVCNLNWILNLTILSLLFPYLFLAFLKKSDFRLWWDEWMERETRKAFMCYHSFPRKRRKPFKTFQDKYHGKRKKWSHQISSFHLLSSLDLFLFFVSVLPSLPEEKEMRTRENKEVVTSSSSFCLTKK